MVGLERLRRVRRNPESPSEINMSETIERELLRLAIEGCVNHDDARFWEIASPLLVAKGITEKRIRDAWLKATPCEGYDNTFSLLGMTARMPAWTLGEVDGVLTLQHVSDGEAYSVDSAPRDILIAYCMWNDPNGCYSDEDSLAEFGHVARDADLRATITQWSQE
jgi:hypothetical protein